VVRSAGIPIALETSMPVPKLDWRFDRSLVRPQSGLPRDVLGSIFAFASKPDLYNICLVCKEWCSVATATNELWQRFSIDRVNIRQKYLEIKKRRKKEKRKQQINSVCKLLHKVFLLFLVFVPPPALIGGYILILYFNTEISTTFVIPLATIAGWVLFIVMHLALLACFGALRKTQGKKLAPSFSVAWLVVIPLALGFVIGGTVISNDTPKFIQKQVLFNATLFDMALYGSQYYAYFPVPSITPQIDNMTVMVEYEYNKNWFIITAAPLTPNKTMTDKDIITTWIVYTCRSRRELVSVQQAKDSCIEEARSVATMWNEICFHTTRDTDALAAINLSPVQSTWPDVTLVTWNKDCQQDVAVILKKKEKFYHKIRKFVTIYLSTAGSIYVIVIIWMSVLYLLH